MKKILRQIHDVEKVLRMLIREKKSQRKRKAMKEEAKNEVDFAHSRQGSSKLAFDEAPKIPKLNLGILQKEQREEYFTKNIFK